jgi:hypothetical protein
MVHCGALFAYDLSSLPVDGGAGVADTGRQQRQWPRYRIPSVAGSGHRVVK